MDNTIRKATYQGDEITVERTTLCVWLKADKEWYRVYNEIESDRDRQFIRNEHGKWIPLSSLTVRKIGSLL